jgi:hypothetical protein
MYLNIGYQGEFTSEDQAARVCNEAGFSVDEGAKVCVIRYARGLSRNLRAERAANYLWQYHDWSVTNG